MSTIPDKPNYVTPAQQPTRGELQAARDTLAKLADVKHAEQLPAQVHALPVTHNMEYGFFAAAAGGPAGQLGSTAPAAPSPIRSPMFQHSKGHCDVTRYAADYFSLTGKHLFGPKGGSGSAGGSGSKAKS